MITLTSTNYSTWKVMMEDMLICNDLYDPIEARGASPADETDRKGQSEWQKKNRKAVATIRQWVDDDIRLQVVNETDAHALWMKLESRFLNKSTNHKLYLFRKLKNQEYREGESITKHMSEIDDLVSRLNAMDLCIDDQMHAVMLLCSLPESWESLVNGLTGSDPEVKLTSAMVKHCMISEESRRMQ